MNGLNIWSISKDKFNLQVYDEYTVRIDIEKGSLLSKYQKDFYINNKLLRMYKYDKRIE